MYDFAEQLKQLRKQRKLKQSDMAEFLKCTVRHYQDIEYGKVNIPVQDFIALADFFGVSLDYLAGRGNNGE